MSKIKPLIAGIVILFLLTSCHKKDNRQYSFWTVNTDSFSTNEVIVNHQGIQRTDIESSGTNNAFGFTFYLSALPTNARLLITNSTTQNDRLTSIGIHYKSKFYNVKKELSDTLICNIVNGRLQFTLAPAWFKNFFDSADTVLVSGTFNEP